MSCLTTVGDVPGQKLETMATDARKRLRRIGATGGATVVHRGPASGDARLRQQRGAGVALAIAGGVTAAAGLALNAAMYEQGRQETDQAAYGQQQTANHVGFVVGLTGAAIGTGGVIVLIASAPRASTLTLAPGPVSTLTVRF